MFSFSKYFMRRRIESVFRSKKERESGLEASSKRYNQLVVTHDGFVSIGELHIPVHIMCEILSFLDWSHVLLNCSPVCRSWYIASSNDYLWSLYEGEKRNIKNEFDLDGQERKLVIVTNAKGIFLKKRFASLVKNARKEERILNRHEKLIRKYRDGTVHGNAHIRPGLYIIKTRVNNVLTDIDFITRKHMLGYLAYVIIVPLFLLFSNQLSNTLPSIMKLIIMLLFSFLGAFIRYITWEAYFDGQGKFPRDKYERLPATLLCLFINLILTIRVCWNVLVRHRTCFEKTNIHNKNRENLKTLPVYFSFHTC
jgi:hypothetical protein